MTHSDGDRDEHDAAAPPITMADPRGKYRASDVPIARY